MSGVNPERWIKLWQAATNAAPPAHCYPELLARYSESHRHYHNLRHLADCLHEFAAARSHARDLIAVELAIWFHDAVYDPRAADNEERSAALAENWLTAANANKTLTDTVCQLVLATQHHDLSRHEAAAVLVDVDLSILGQPPERFWEYERQIRDEYAWVPVAVFAAKRGEILESFLARPQIYTTPTFFHRLEAQARINLSAAVARLRN